MDEFAYRDGTLHAEEVALDRIADAVGTPVYCYASTAMERAYRAFAEAFRDMPVRICYALKANDNVAVVRTLARLGAGADVVSGGELSRALAAGVPGAGIVFSGVGKTRAEMAAAMDAGILQFNVESEAELAALSEVAGSKGRRAPAALRVNPNIDAFTHDKIATGRREDKFGIDFSHALEVYARGAGMPGIEMTGLAMHIGSQITDLDPYRGAFRRLGGLVGALREAGHEVRRLDLGGGLGVTYERERPPAPADYAAVAREIVLPLGCDMVIEPGRRLVAEAGVLLTRVLYVKTGAAHTFVVVDAAMNDLLRPALYDAYHRIVPVAEPAADAEPAPVEVVGPVCETTDTFARNRPLPPVKAGDLLAIHTVGAYGAVMSSGYNSRALVPEVLVRGGDFAVIRARRTNEEFMAQERLPDWLSEPSGSRTRGVA